MLTRNKAGYASILAAAILLAGCASVGPDDAAPAASDGASVSARSAPQPSTGGLTDEEMQRQQEQDDAFFARRDAYIDALGAKGVDIRTLKRVELAVLVIAPPPTLSALMAESEMVVVGTISSFHFDHTGTVATVKVSQVVKGTAAVDAPLPVRVGLQLEPNDDFTGAVLGAYPGYPKLVPDEQVVFFLVKSQISGGWTAAHPAHVMTVDNGVVTTDESLPFYKDVHGQSLDAIVRKLQS